jgi:hypothetical protein
MKSMSPQIVLFSENIPQTQNISRPEGLENHLLVHMDELLTSANWYLLTDVRGLEMLPPTKQWPNVS